MPRRPHTSFIPLTPEQQREVEGLSQSPGWRALPQSELPTFLPASLRARLDSAVVISSSTVLSGRTYVVCNGLRVDRRADAIDHEPFVISVLSSDASTGGMFVHHGDWNGRTEQAPAEFWESVERSGVGDYFFANPPSGRTFGELADLDAPHKRAFYRAIELLRAAEEPST